jgi:D-alanyl-D-alanine carboxypeptidase/D-alanyl-D-alanine-endopeptidase (penicillin-binding protein 4)
MVSLLQASYRDASIAPEFVAHLSIGGVDGTLRGRFRSWGAQGNVRAKTGTLKTVASLSGYVLGPAGRAPLAFAIFANDIPDKVGLARPLIDKVIDAAADALWTNR